MQLVYVLNKKGNPLMPTSRCGHVRWLIKTGKAVVVNNNPFTIRLKYETSDCTQQLTLGIDPGRENIGLAVSNDQGDCLFQAVVKTNNKQIKKKMEERKAHRSSRRRYKRIKKQRRAIRSNTTIVNGSNDVLRTKKTCESKQVSYPGMEESITHKVIQGKEAKFNNRKRAEGWLTPSARNLVQIHCNLVKKVQQILPITNIAIERNSFDFQKLENQSIKSWQYTKGLLYGFKNYKEYVFAHQGGMCLMCSKSAIVHYHHIEYRSKNGSDSVANIAGLCDECHTLVHNDSSYEADLFSLKQGLKKQHTVSLLNSCMHIIIEELNNLLPTMVTDGYTTKSKRESLKLTKEHFNDAYCISLVNTKCVGVIYSNNYTIRHFKKKSNNNIHKLNRREYYYKDKLIAINRHKAFNQKEDSIEEYINKYLLTHTQEELNKHIHEIEIKPANRTYTKHKQGIVSLFKCGDKVLYRKKNKIKGNIKQRVFIVESVNQERLEHNKTKNFKVKYCTLLQSNSLEYI